MDEKLVNFRCRTLCSTSQDSDSWNYCSCFIMYGVNYEGWNTLISQLNLNKIINNMYILCHVVAYKDCIPLCCKVLCSELNLGNIFNPLLYSG